MLKEMLEQKIGQTLTNAEFAVICEIVSDDIKFNRIGFKKLTSLDYVLDISERSAFIFENVHKKELQ